MEKYRWSRCIASLILNCKPDEDNLSASHPGRFNPTVRNAGTHCIRNWVGSRASRTFGEQKNLLPSPEI